MDGYDRNDFDPGLAALLSVLRDRLYPEPVPAFLDLIREPMPADLKALLLTMAHRGRWFLSVPAEVPATHWWIEDRYLEFPRPERLNELAAIGAGHLLQLGSDPGGHVELYAAWDGEDSAFRLECWNDEDYTGRRIGTFEDLLVEALLDIRYEPESTTDLDCDEHENPGEVDFDHLLEHLDGKERNWVARARDLGAVL
jgi:hypothetical protein